MGLFWLKNHGCNACASRLAARGSQEREALLGVHAQLGRWAAGAAVAAERWSRLKTAGPGERSSEPRGKKTLDKLLLSGSHRDMRTVFCAGARGEWGEERRTETMAAAELYSKVKKIIIIIRRRRQSIYDVYNVEAIKPLNVVAHLTVTLL